MASQQLVARHPKNGPFLTNRDGAETRAISRDETPAGRPGLFLAGSNGVADGSFTVPAHKHVLVPLVNWKLQR
jgi:hypothetical protein